jgi:hypothetical protein
VQPNRVQQILYGSTLRPYICADLIGKTLVEKSSIAPGLIFTDNFDALDLRLKLEVPVVWLAPSDDTRTGQIMTNGHCVRPASGQCGAIFCHPRFSSDVPVVREMVEKFEGMVDPAEPFLRIREAMGEARKMGVTKAA